MTGRVIIVTGSSSGIGYETARYLCEGGNDVILACRNEEKANRAIEKIKRTNPNALASFMKLDLSDLESVRKFVEAFRETGKKLNVLVNNAGVAYGAKDTSRKYTTENFEITVGTNHLGPFLLTNLLLEDLKKAAAEENGDARIVTVASHVHDQEAIKRRSNLQPIDLDDLFLFKEGVYNGFQAYKNSKAANIMFTYELARKLEDSKVKANCVCPGFVPGTDLNRNSGGMQKFFNRWVLHGMLRFTKITRSVQQGAMAVCNLATDEKYKEVTGKYFKDGQEVKSSEETLNEENQKKLWELSGGYTSLEGFEPITVERPPEPEPPKKEEKAKKKEGEEEGEAAGEAKAEEGEAKEEGKAEEEGEKKDEETKPEEGKPEDTKETKEETKEEKPEEKSEKPAEEKPAEDEKKE
eukprot:GHVU01051773.1.p1 GENE.GHVU01051773.1~~GHVU01051773.1.p1  ORF type:complete len:410 (+),score=109.43 GHVU01051773.1:88-1317(+)